MWPQWQARLYVATEPLAPMPSLFEGASLRPQSAAFFGDYYVTRPYIGQAGGLRLTSGLVAGMRGSVISPGQATAPGAFGFTAQARQSLGSSIDASSDVLAWPYLGIGYSDSSLRGGWGSAPTSGLQRKASGCPGAARSLGNLSLDDMVRDMRLTPVLQLGVNYRF